MISRKFLFSLLLISVIILFSIPFCFGGEVVLTGVIIPRGFDCERLQAMENNTLINYSLSNDVDCSMTNPTSWDISRSGLDRCCAIVDGTCTIECTGKNAGGSEPNYWYYSTNPPLNEWDFTTIWKEETDDYPSLRKP